MPAIARAELESLLRSRKLDHTLSGAFPGPDPGDPRWFAPTGLPDLDRRLGGGFPRGELSEIVGPRSSGRLAMLLSALAAATSRGEAVAFVDPLDMFDPPSAAASGVDFARLLWVRGEPLSAGRAGLAAESGVFHTLVDRGVKALNLVLQAGGFGLVALDLAEVPPQVTGRMPFTTWLRLHRVIEGGETACLLLGREPIARSAAGLTVLLGASGAGGASGVLPSPYLPRSPQIITSRVIRARALEAGRDVCVSVSPAIA